MRINELAKVSCVNMETIRMYRKKGLLNPKRDQNGYYDYTPEDLQALLHIRKLRSMNVSLNTIGFTYCHSDTNELLNGMYREYDQLEKQIEELKREQFMLKVTIDHFESYRENSRGVMVIEIPDDRYDLPLEEYAGREELQAWLDNMDLFTLGLHIPAEVLRDGDLPEKIPFRVTVGTYAPIIAMRKLNIPEQAILSPKGTYLAMPIEISGEQTLERKQLMPLIRFAEENGYRILGDMTGFQFAVKREKDRLIIQYRIRIRAEKCEPA